MTHPPEDEFDHIRVFHPDRDEDLEADEPPTDEPKPALDAVIATMRQGEYPRGTLVGLSDLTVREAARLDAAWPDVATEVRRAVVSELNDLAEERIDYVFGRALMTMLDDDDSAVRLGAIAGLWGHEDDRLGDRLVAMLEWDPSEDVRAAAAGGLAWFVEMAEYEEIDEALGDRVYGALVATLEDDAQPIRVRARALESASARSGSDAVRRYIEEFYGEDETGYRATAIFAMGRTYDAAYLPRILNETSTDDAELRFEAARAAGRIGDNGALPVLADLGTDEDAEVRHAAINAMGEIGGKAAIRYLLRLAESAPEADTELIDDAIMEATIVSDPLLLEDES